MGLQRNTKGCGDAQSEYTTIVKKVATPEDTVTSKDTEMLEDAAVPDQHQTQGLTQENRM